MRWCCWSLSGATGGLRGGWRWWRPTAVQVFNVEHDELPALLWDALQDEVSFVILKDLLDVFQMLVRFLYEFS